MRQRFTDRLRWSSIAAVTLHTCLPAAALAQRINTIKPASPHASVTLDGIVYDAILIWTKPLEEKSR